MNRQQFIDHARDEIAAADATLAGHHEQGAGCCHCGLPWICSIFEKTSLRKAHYVRQLTRARGNN